MTLPTPNDMPVNVPTTSSSTDSKEQEPGKHTETLPENEGEKNAAGNVKSAKRGVRGPRTLRRARSTPRSTEGGKAGAEVVAESADMQQLADGGENSAPV